MKRLLLVSLLFLSGLTNAQVTDTIVVEYTKTAYLIFEDSEIKYDCGSEDVLVRKSDNKLIVQAGLEEFETTNLFVEASGSIYLFIIQYGDPDGKFVFNYSKKVKTTSENNSSNTGNEILAIDTENNDSIKASYEAFADSLLLREDRITNRGVVEYKLGIYLKDMVFHENKMFLKFEVKNNSNIPYYVDFYQYRVKSVKKRIKGESFQEIELVPELEYKRPEVFQGNSVTRYVVVLDKFVLTNNKRLVIEHWEDNGRDMDIEGGRKVDFDIFYKDILNAKI